MRRRYLDATAAQPGDRRVVETAVLDRRKTMPTIAHRSTRLPVGPHRKLTIWLVSALLVAAVAVALAVSLIGSGGQATDPGPDAGQPAQQGPTPFSGAHP
jgi:hypothetical protein